MKKSFFIYLLLLCSFFELSASTVRESLKFNSQILGREVSYSIYLPEGYDTSNRLYPVLYLLHGWSDNETSWIQMGNMQTIADQTIQNNEAAPMIIVMPDAKVTWYVNAYNDKDSYEDMFFKELIPEIEKKYRTRTEKQYRAVAGLSMGGYGSFIYALHHPEYFSACAPLSAAVYTDEDMKEYLKTYYAKEFEGIYGKGLITDHWYKNSVLHLVKNAKKEDLSKVRFYIDCGDDDDLLHGNYLIHEMMQEKNVKHEFRVRDGGHSWTYWRTALPEVMKFVSRRFLRS